MRYITAIAVVLISFVTEPASAQSNIDPEHKWAWSENCGWTNWQHDVPEPGDGVFVTQTHLAGFVWGENIGWINFDDETHFVSLDLDCPADLNNDCDVEAADLAELLGDWGPCEEPCEPGDPATTCVADLSGDCDAEAFDLAILLGSWGFYLE